MVRPQTVRQGRRQMGAEAVWTFCGQGKRTIKGIWMLPTRRPQEWFREWVNLWRFCVDDFYG